MNTPEWFKRKILPPVGEMVRYETSFFSRKKATKGHCKIVAYHKDMVWIEVIRGIDHCINLNVISFYPEEDTTDYDFSVKKARLLELARDLIKEAEEL